MWKFIHKFWTVDYRRDEKKEQNAKKLKLLPLFFSYVPEYPYVAYRERDV